MYSAVSGNVGIGLSSPSAKLELRGAIKNSTVGDTATIVFSRTAETGNPTGDGFRMKYNNNYYGANCDALVLEKVDGQSANPDGGIVFTNTGNDGVEESALTIRGTGYVGINTNTPGNELDVNGTASMNGFQMPTGASSGYVLTSDGSGTGTWQAAGDDGDWTISGDDMYSALSGNVGIGTSTPTAKLNAVGSTTSAHLASDTVAVYGEADDNYAGYFSGEVVAFRDVGNSAYQATITGTIRDDEDPNSFNAGIKGVYQAREFPLPVYYDKYIGYLGSWDAGVFGAHYMDYSGYFVDYFGLVGTDGSGVDGLSNDTRGLLATSSEGVKGYHYDSDNFGYLASADYGAYGKHFNTSNYGYLGGSTVGAYGKHEVSGSYGYLGGSSYGVYGYSSVSYGGRFDGGVYVNGTIVVDNKVQAEDSDGLHLATDEGATRLHVNNSGYIGIHTTTASYPLDVDGDIECIALHETSDDRLKTNVQTLDNALDKVERLRGVSFEWNTEAESAGAKAGDRQIGVLASEVESVFPELVSTPEHGYKSVDYTKLTAVLIEAVKELQARVETLETQNQQLLNMTR
jgi:hypothetical protein